MEENFDPTKADRPPRQDGYIEETSKICELLKYERGDRRIGQLLINAVRNEIETGDVEEDNASRTVSYLFNIEAPELLELLEKWLEKTSEENSE